MVNSRRSSSNAEQGNGGWMLIEKQVFENVKSLGSHRTFEGLELRRCEFIGCALSQSDDPDLGLVIRDVTVTRCIVKRSHMHGVRLDNVVIDGLATSSTPNFSGCAFRHVTIRGRIGGLLFLPPDQQSAFTDSIMRFYESVDWAIDISRAEFTSVNFFFVPGDLVRRDAETQYLLRRERFADVDLSELPLRARIEVGRFELTPFDSIVAIAPKRSKHFAEIKADLDVLRRMALAE